MYSYSYLTFVHRRRNLHFKLEVPAHVVSWEPAAEVVAEHLITARGEMVLSLLQRGQPAPPPAGHPQVSHTSLKTFRLTRKYNPRWHIIIQCNKIHSHKGILTNPPGCKEILL